jgi:ribosomal protein L29
MKKNTVNGKTSKELNDLLKDKRKKLFDFRFNILGGKIKNVKEGRGLRKEIAQILTELNNVKA